MISAARPPAAVSAVAVLTAAVLVSACAASSKQQLARDVAQVVRGQSGVAPEWRRAESAAQRQAITERLEAGITPDSAVEVALLASPDLQAIFERLGIARAEFLEHATPANPVLGWSRLTERGGPGSKVEWSVVQNITDLLTLPIRRRAADRELDAARFDAADSLLQHIAAVRAAWMNARASEALATLALERSDLARLETELMQRYVAAGNEPQRELRELQLDYADWQRAAAAATEARLAAREELARLMGVSDAQVAWELSGEFAPLPDDDGEQAELEAAMLRNRLDVQAARRRVESRLADLGDARVRRVLPELSAGYIRERDTGERSAGPELSLEVPLFTAAQVASARQDAAAALALREAEAAALAARTEVRLARERVLQARAALVLARDSDLPAAEALADIRQREMHFMLIGPFEALQARGAVMAAAQRRVEAERDYWQARLALARAAALPLQAVREWAAATAEATP